VDGRSQPGQAGADDNDGIGHGQSTPASNELPPLHSALHVCLWHCCAASMVLWHAWEILLAQPWWHWLSSGAQAQLHERYSEQSEIALR
jgi:hypothetical protein